MIKPNKVLKTLILKLVGLCESFVGIRSSPTGGHRLAADWVTLPKWRCPVLMGSSNVRPLGILVSPSANY